MKRIILLVSILLLVFGATAQENQRAVGIRGGLSSGFEYRVFTSDYHSYKALLSTRDQGVQLVGIKEFHEPGLLDMDDQFCFVYGFGLHLGFERWNASEYRNGYYYRETRTAPVAGLDGLAGVEYTFMEVPLTLGFEAKPFFDVFGRKVFRIQPFDFAFTLKYNF
ncbi:MAG: hypothetical protein RBS73_07125 [Prolixibacteraceae bacterium]|jgi:hypothetical protein|nr:hypothetical protein [Prolixibacteraceae bacterium]